MPLTSFSGTSAGYTNPYNGSNQYNFAAKHDGELFFTATNGGNEPTSPIPRRHYAPLQQLQTDLTNNTVARYNWITPDQYNDMHTALNAGFTYNGITYTGEQTRKSRRATISCRSSFRRSKRRRPTRTTARS